MSGSPVGYGGQRPYHVPHQAPEQTGAKASTYANAAGAFVSLALLVGVGIWGYQLLVRDVSGVPVVRATEGPWRVAPENPGGQAADNQGLAVNEVAGRGTASGPVDQVALAPAAVGLDEGDLAGQRLSIVAPPPITAQGATMPKLAVAADTRDDLSETRRETRAETVAMPIMTNRVDGGARKPIANSTIQALADQIAADVTPLGAVAPAAAPPATTSLKPMEDTVAAVSKIDAPGVRRSPRPRTRPAQLFEKAVAAIVIPASAPVAAAEAPVAANLPVGTRLVQLGAYESASIAEQEWARISGKFDSFFDGKARVVQKAQSGGRTFYRLRAHGFDDLADARRFCAALVAERADCIPVVIK
ncbi:MULTISPECIES: SPOR domain-containing protein [unclassified Marinovum]